MKADQVTAISVALIIIVGMIPISWYRTSHAILKGDNSPFWFLSSRTFFGDMSTWWEADTLGHMSGLPSLTVYSFIWFTLQSFGFSNEIIQVLLTSILIISSGLTMFYFLSTLFGKKPLPLLVGSLFYTINVSVMISMFNVGMSWMRAFLPLVLALFVKLLQKRVHKEPSMKLFLCFMLAFSFSMSFLTVNPPILVVSLLCMGVTALYVGLAERKIVQVTLESVKIAVFSILASLWWIIPFAFSALQTVGLAGNVNVWDWTWTHSRASILNILWLNADWGWRPEYYPYMEYYLNPIVILAMFVPIVIAAFGLLFSRSNRTLRYFFFSTVILSIFLAKGLHSPFEQVNFFLYEYIPEFAVLFREPVSKFTFMMTLFMAPLIAGGTDLMLGRLEARAPLTRKLPKKAVSFCFVAALCLILVIPSAPMFSGLAVETKTEQLPFPSYVRVPKYWFEVGDYFSKDTDDFRVLVTPDDVFYQMPYKWGYYGSDVLPLRFISKPVLYHTYGYQQKKADDLLDILYQSLEKRDMRTFNNLLTAMNVKYILLRNDIFWNFTSALHIADPEIINSRLTNNTELEFVQSIGELDIFRYKNWGPRHFYATTKTLEVDGSPTSIGLLSPYIDFKNNVVVFSEERESQQTTIANQNQNDFVYVVNLSDLNKADGTFFREVKLHASGMYKIDLISNISIPISVDGGFLSLSKNNSSFTTSTYLTEGVHRIEIGLLEEKSLLLESWKNATIENQFGAVYTFEIEQDALKATLYNSTWGWKTLNSPIIEVHTGKKYEYDFSVRGNNVHQLHAKVLEYDENFNLLGVSYGGFLLEGNFEYTPLNVTYSPQHSEARYAQLALWHGHETDNSLPNIIWLKDVKVIIDSSAGFDGVLLSPNSFLLEESETGRHVELDYARLSAYEYRVHVKTGGPFFLFFSESYDSLWKVIEGDLEWYEVPFHGELSSYHLPANGFGNMWFINKTGNFDITVFYAPQAHFYYASVASSFIVGIFVLLGVVQYSLVKKESPPLKKNASGISLFSFGSLTPLSGIFIRTRQLTRALITLNQSLNVIELGYRNRDPRRSGSALCLKNSSYRAINFVSQAPSKGEIYQPMRQMAFQFESLKTLRLAKLLRGSRIVILTSCLQVFPALISKLLGAKIVLDINDVNSRTSMGIQDTATRTIRYLFWRPLESLGCLLANIVLINKEEEAGFLTKHLHINPLKILVVKTCLEENHGGSGNSLKSELDKFELGDKRIILFLANMTAFMNQDAANYIIRKLAPSFAKLAEFKDAMFVLAGMGSDNLQPLTSNVVTAGTLSEASVNALIDRADICIDPALISGGVKTKIQYYLKKGKVIVTTPAGAEGINLYRRKDLAFLKSRIEHFENTLEYALMNLEYLKRQAVNNCDVYEKQFSWETFIKQVTALLQELSETSQVPKSNGV
jgi:hypothetical protein